MADEAFVSADIEKLVQFQKESEAVIKEFNSIKTEFESINSTLLKKWQGEGADAYKDETDHILEKIGGVEDVLKGINEGVIMDIKDNYMSLDEQLAEFNRNPQSADADASNSQ